MSDRFHSIIVIPCFNESNNFQIKDYSNFISNNLNVLICFVNDGSNDNTLLILNELKGKFPINVDIVSYKKNVGKGEAVRTGMTYCLDKYDYEYIAYLDADLAVSLQECMSMSQHLSNDIIFCFGSRIRKIGSYIERKRSRFLIGRFIATLISNILSLKVYDTQCGCKVFTKELSKQVFTNAFISKWLFDVEIFFRIIALYGEKDCLRVMLEVPLVQWIDKGDSKVKNTYFFKLFLDLYQIKRKYKQTLTLNKRH